MTPDRWQRVKHVFDSVLEREPEARTGLLEAECGSDLDLRDEVESLLASYAGAQEFIESPLVVRAVLPALHDASTSWADRRLGPYRLAALIASGGMGAVYEGVRCDDAYEKRVAIKLIPSARLLADPIRQDELLRRFHTERQTLANLDHPHIAKLLDGGTTEDGVPYLVMDYIAGEPIDGYCDRRHLTTGVRLSLFRDVCSAVQYAHQHLVVHRDLKPSNILVTVDGMVKLLDFGIAKLLPVDGADDSGDVTAPEGRFMTPDYASPEQIRGWPVTTASDVYSLGVVLYQLLTGRKPYRLNLARRDELTRIICEQIPEKPSTAPAHSETAPAADGTQEKLRRRLRGDLDMIVLMALRKEPQRRYCSVEQFSEDIRRHLEGLPVIARKDTWGYRTAKFVRRHQIGVAFSAVVAAALAAAGMLTLQQRNVALAEAQSHREVTEVLLRLFESSDPIEGNQQAWGAPSGAAPPLMLEPGINAVADLAHQPITQARLMDVLGTTLLNLGFLDRAAQLLDQAVGIRRGALGQEHPDTLLSMDHLGQVLRSKGDWKEAESLLRQTLALRRRILGNDHQQTLISVNNLAGLLREHGDAAEAESLHREALDGATRVLGDDDKLTLQFLNNLAVFLAGRNKRPEAEQLFRRALEAQARVLGAENPDTILSMSNLASVLRDQNKLAEAEPLIRETLDAWRRVLPAHHPSVLTEMRKLANLYRKQERWTEAEPLLRDALDLQRRALGEGHADTLSTAHSLAVLLQQQDRLEDAESLFRGTLEISRSRLGDRHEQTVLSMNGLGDVYMKQGKPGQAEPLFREALGTALETKGPEHQTTAGFESDYGACLTKLNRFQEAEPHLRTAFDTLKAGLGPEHKRTLLAVRRLVDLYEAWGKHDRAEQYRTLLSSEHPARTGE